MERLTDLNARGFCTVPITSKGSLCFPLALTQDMNVIRALIIFLPEVFFL